MEVSLEVILTAWSNRSCRCGSNRSCRCELGSRLYFATSFANYVMLRAVLTNEVVGTDKVCWRPRTGSFLSNTHFVSDVIFLSGLVRSSPQTHRHLNLMEILNKNDKKKRIYIPKNAVTYFHRRFYRMVYSRQKC